VHVAKFALVIKVGFFESQVDIILVMSN